LRLGVGFGWLGSGCLHFHAGWRKVEVVEAGVCSIVLLYLVYELSQELEGDRRFDIFRAEISEVCILFVE